MSKSNNDALLAGIERIKAEMELKKKRAESNQTSSATPQSNPVVEIEESNSKELSIALSNRTSNTYSNNDNSHTPGTTSDGMIDFLLPRRGIKETKCNFSFYIKVANKERLDMLARYYGYDKASPVLDGILSRLFDAMGPDYWKRIEVVLGRDKETL